MWKAAFVVLALLGAANAGPHFDSVGGITTPISVADGGVSYLPSDSIASYNLAIDLSATYVGMNLQLSSDDQFVCRRDADISRSTDVETRSWLANKRGPRGFTVADLTKDELLQLRLQPKGGEQQAIYNGIFAVPSFQEALALVKRRAAGGATVGIYLDMVPQAAVAASRLASRLRNALEANDMLYGSMPVLVASPDAAFLRELRPLVAGSRVRTVLKIDSSDDFSRAGGLESVHDYANGVAVEREVFLSGDLNVAAAAHSHSLFVIAYTHPYSADIPQAEVIRDLRAMLDGGADGVMSDRMDDAGIARHGIAPGTTPSGDNFASFGTRSVADGPSEVSTGGHGGLSSGSIVAICMLCFVVLAAAIGIPLYTRWKGITMAEAWENVRTAVSPARISGRLSAGAPAASLSPSLLRDVGYAGGAGGSPPYRPNAAGFYDFAPASPRPFAAQPQVNVFSSVATPTAVYGDSSSFRAGGPGRSANLGIRTSEGLVPPAAGPYSTLGDPATGLPLVRAPSFDAYGASAAPPAGYPGPGALHHSAGALPAASSAYQDAYGNPLFRKSGFAVEAEAASGRVLAAPGGVSAAYSVASSYSTAPLAGPGAGGFQRFAI